MGVKEVSIHTCKPYYLALKMEPENYKAYEFTSI